MQVALKDDKGNKLQMLAVIWDDPIGYEFNERAADYKFARPCSADNLLRRSKETNKIACEVLIIYSYIIAQLGAHGLAKTATVHLLVAKKVNTLHIREVVGSHSSAPR